MDVSVFDRLISAYARLVQVKGVTLERTCHCVPVRVKWFPGYVIRQTHREGGTEGGGREGERDRDRKTERERGEGRKRQTDRERQRQRDEVERDRHVDK